MIEKIYNPYDYEDLKKINEIIDWVNNSENRHLRLLTALDKINSQE